MNDKVDKSDKKSSLYKDIESTFIKVGKSWYTTINDRMRFDDKEKGILFFEKEENGKSLYSIYKYKLEKQNSFIRGKNLA